MSEDKPPISSAAPLTAAWSAAGSAAGPSGEETHCLSPQNELAVPAELMRHPRYRVLALLGQGGMGAVYKAQHTHMDRVVALKVIRPSLVKHPASLKRFQQEVRAAARLAHANIVTAHDADEAGGLHFLVMEFVEGQSLAEYLRQRGPLPVAEACSYVRQVALGLQHAHERGMVHRDIKPHNLMRTPTGEIKILDFGLVRLGQSEPSEEARPAAPAANADGVAESAEHLTDAGILMGTMDYIAPEQAVDAHSSDIRADIYSLGCTFYQMLSGQVLFPGGSVADKLLRHQKAMPAPLSHRRSDVPRALEEVLLRMLAKQPDQRYQTPDEVVAALADFTSEAAAPSRPAAQESEERPLGALDFAGQREGTEIVPRSTFAFPHSRRSWLLLAALMLLVLGGVAVVGLTFRHGLGPSKPLDGTAEPENANGPPPVPVVPALADGKDVSLPGHFDTITRVAVGGRGLAISGGFDRTPLIWDLSTLTLFKRLPPHPDTIWCVALSPDGRYAATGGQHKIAEGRDPVNHDALHLWDVETGRLRKLTGHQAVVHQVLFTSDSKRLLSSSWDRSVRIWDVSGQRPPRSFAFDAPALAIALFRGDKELLVATTDGFIHRLNLATGKESARFRGPGDEYLAVSADGRYVLACGSRGPDGEAARTTILLHDLTTHRQRRLRGHSDTVNSVAFSADGRLALSAGKDATVRLWDVVSGRELYCYGGHQGEVRSAVFTRDGQSILSAGAEHRVRLWPLPPSLR